MYPIGTRMGWAHNGVSRRIFVMRGGKRSDFEEAIFILKEEAGLSDDEFLAEAEALAGDLTLPGKKSGARLPWFFTALSSLLLIGSWILFFALR